MQVIGFQSRQTVRQILGRRLAEYEKQIADAKEHHDRYAEKVGRILQGEILSLWSEMLGTSKP